MKLLFLPGNGEDREWNREVRRALLEVFDDVYLLEYAHWLTGRKLIDLDFEVEHLRDVIEREGYEDYMILGKSAGTMLAARAVQEEVVAPKRCVFLGVPIIWAKEYGFKVDEIFENYSVPTLFIQQSNDPVASFLVLNNFLPARNVHNYQLKEVPGRDHKYDDIEYLKEETRRFINVSP